MNLGNTMIGTYNAGGTTNIKRPTAIGEGSSIIGHFNQMNGSTVNYLGFLQNLKMIAGSTPPPCYELNRDNCPMF